MAEKVGGKKGKDIFESQQNVSLTAVLLELPNCIALGVLSILSGSFMLKLDVVESISNTIQAGISFSLSKKLQSDERFKYDYGMGKIDALGSLISTSILLIGLLAILIGAIHTLFVPSVPGEILLLAICLKIINVAVDVFLLRKQLNVAKKGSSAIVESTTLLLKKDLVFDSVVLITILISYFFRSSAFIVYVEPVVCILCVMYIAFHTIKQIRRASSDLLDRTLDEESQMKILSCVSKIWGDIDGFHGVRTRRSGASTYIDLMVSFDPEKPYAEIYKAYEKFDMAVKNIIPGSISAIVIGNPDCE